MKINYPDVKFPPHLNLGFVCDKEKTDFADRDYKIKSWGKKVKAKSFTIISCRYEPYGLFLNGHVEVAYFTTEKEGQFVLDSLIDRGE